MNFDDVITRYVIRSFDHLEFRKKRNRLRCRASELIIVSKEILQIFFMDEDKLNRLPPDVKKQFLDIFQKLWYKQHLFETLEYMHGNT